MSPRKILLYGRPRSGKTSRAHQVFLDAWRADPKGTALVVPSESARRHALSRLLSMPGVRAVDGNAVLTIEQLATRLHDAPHRTADHMTLRMILDRFLDETPPHAYREHAHRQAFRAALLESLGEVFEEDVAPTRLQSGLGGLIQSDRASAYVETYGHMRESLSARSMHHRSTLRHRAADAVREGRCKKHVRTVVADGFFRLNTSDRALLSAVWDDATSALFTLPCDPDDADPAFASIHDSASAFDSSAVERLAPIERGDALSTIASSLFKGRHGGDPRGLTVLTADDDDAVFDESVRLILRAKRSGEIRRWSDAGIVVRSNPERPSLRRALDRFEMPFSVEGSVRLDETPAGRAVLELIETILEGGEGRTTCLGAEVDIDALRDAARSADQTGVRRALSELLSRVCAAAAPGGTDLVRRAREGAALSGLATALERSAETGAAGLDAVRLWADAIRAARVQVYAPFPDAVSVADTLNARWWERPLVIVAGLVEGRFPGTTREDIFLPDDVRSHLNARLGTRFRLERQWRHEERLLFLTSCTRATEHLVLARPLVGEDDQEAPPSLLVLELEECLGEKVMQAAAHESPPAHRPRTNPLEIDHPDDLLLLAIDDQADPSASQDARAAVESSLSSLRDEVLLALPRGTAVVRDPSRITNLLKSVHASRLDDAIRCPFLFFATSILRLEPKEIDEPLDARDEGTLLHEALAALARGLARSPEEAVARAWSDKIEDGWRFIGSGRVRDRIVEWVRAIWPAEEKRIRAAARSETEMRIEATLGDFMVPVSGIADRVDFDSDSAATVVEYKRRMSDRHRAVPGHKRLYAQETAYMAGLLGRGCTPVLAVRWFAQDRQSTSTDEDLEAGASLEQIVSDATKAMGAMLSAIAGGDVALRPDRPEHCKPSMCAGWALCRIGEGGR